MENKDQQGIVEVVADKIWKFFSSVKLALVLPIILAVVSVIGTVIQQNQAPEDYLREYSQATVELFESLGILRSVSYLVVRPSPFTIHGESHHLYD